MIHTLTSFGKNTEHMIKRFHIVLQETVTKKMLIEAPSKKDAEATALNFHFGWSGAEENARIKELSVTREGTISEDDTDLSWGSMHSSAVD